jgi:predicted Holliday junction resolvase-like endonuclease
MTIRILTLTTVLTLGSLLAGCSNNNDAICEKQQECFDDDLDTGECAERIDEWVEDKDEDDRRQRVEECARCVDGRTCAQVLESCIDDCFDVPR